MPNETINTILKRRSIRAFKEEQIKDGDLELIVKAGLYAPSAMNQQSWHLTVISKKEVIEKINSTAKEIFKNSDVEYLKERAKSEKFDLFYNAPAIIIISGDQSAVLPESDAAAATENILLAAASLGIGSVWVGSSGYIFPTEAGKALKKELGIPDEYKPINIAALGYNAAEAPAAPPRKENKVNYIR
ncbi:MAG TPA: nitroreductase family protein [Clostridia bacterium]